MLSAGLPEHADRPSPPISDSRAAATTLQLRTPTPYRRVFRLPDGRPVLLAVGRTGRAPGAGFSGAGLAASDAAISSGSACSTTSAALAGLRRLSTLRVCVRTSAVRSRSETSSGVAKNIDE